MAYQYLTFTKAKSIQTINLNADKMALRLISLCCKGHSAEVLKGLRLTLFSESNKNGRSFNEDVGLGFRSIANEKTQEYLVLNHNLSDELEGNVRVEIKGIGNANMNVVLKYDIDNLNIPITEPLRLFEDHFNAKLNYRILFSAPYGSGKTTFLKLFFDAKESEYEVFHIYPVNFSVSANEDIFRYIKAEMLFQLFQKDVCFDFVEQSYFQSIKKFWGKRMTDILAPFLLMIPQLGRDIHDVYEKISVLYKQFMSDHDEYNKDDEAKAKEFISELYEKEGSIYEDNFYTRLIRGCVNQLRVSGKRIVLVIDDLDRMDPEHIFRILNVLTANVDDYTPLGLGSSNKFGFDKIVLVADYNNLVSIFKHKYGDNTDYRGYLDKFFSRSVFYFKNSDAIFYLAEEFTSPQNGRGLPLSEYFRLVMRMLVLTGNLSIRELLRIHNFNNDFLTKDYERFAVVVPFYFLSHLMTIEELEFKLNKAKHVYDEFPDRFRGVNIDDSIWMILAFLGKKSKKGGEEMMRIEFNNKVYEFNWIYEGEVLTVDLQSLFTDGEKGWSENVFKGRDFSEALLILFEDYKSNQLEYNKWIDKTLNADYVVRF